MMTLRAVPDQTMREALEFLTAPWSSVHSRSSSVVKFFLGFAAAMIRDSTIVPISPVNETSSFAQSSRPRVQSSLPGQQPFSCLAHHPMRLIRLIRPPHRSDARLNRVADRHRLPLTDQFFL